MKKLITTLFFLLVTVFIWAQTPQAINYQGVARDVSGNILANQNITLRLSILSGSSIGTAVYVENHARTTDGFGLFTLKIGQGNVESGVFSGINWGNNSYYLKVEIDPMGGTNYQIVGANQFLSVPYALYSNSSGGSAPGNNPGDMLYWNGTAWVIVPAGVHGQQLSFCNGVPTWGGCPPLLITTAASAITSTSANSGGNVTSDGGSSVTARGVCYSTSPNPTTANSTVASGTGTGSFAATLTGLSAGTTYYIRAYASNANGTAYGNQLSFTTLAIPSLTTTSMSSITSNSAVSGGNISSDGGATVTARGVCWSTSPSPTIASTKTIDGTGTGSFVSTLSGLSSNTLYYIRAYATNSVGTAYGSEISFTTFSPPLATTKAPTSVGITSATLNGTANALGSSTTVSFDYGTSISYGNNISATPSPISGSSNTAVTAALSGLTTGSTYHYRLKAVNIYGTTYGNDTTFVPSAIPSAITNSATSVSTTGATLNGQVNANGLTTTVSFEYGTSVSYGNTIAASPASVSGSSNIGAIATLGSLTAGTTYHFRVKAVNALGTTYGADSTFTPAAVPIATTNSASSISTTGATVNGQVNANGLSTTVSFEYGTSLSYGSTATATQSPVTGSTLSNVSVSLTSLLTGTTYHFRVKAVNALGTTYGADSIFTPASVPIATTNSASSITTTGANLNGQVNANGLSTTVSFEYGTSISYGSTAVAAQSPVSGSTLTNVSVSLTSLVTGTTYHFRVKAVNALGTVYGSDSLFSTISKATLTTNVVDSITSNSARSGGNISSNGGSAVTERGICYDTLPNPTV